MGFVVRFFTLRSAAALSVCSKQLHLHLHCTARHVKILLNCLFFVFVPGGGRKEKDRKRKGGKDHILLLFYWKVLYRLFISRVCRILSDSGGGWKERKERKRREGKEGKKRSSKAGCWRGSTGTGMETASSTGWNGKQHEAASEYVQ